MLVLEERYVLSKQPLQKKNKPNADDPVDVLSKVGGFDLAGLVGILSGRAYYHVPVIMDGFHLSGSGTCDSANV